MHNNKKDEELLSRREFFKNAAKGVLPILAFTVFGSSVLTACEKEDDERTCKNGCSGGCKKSCSGSCDNDCSGTCHTYTAG